MIDQKIVNSLIEDAKGFWPKRWPEIQEYFQKICLSAAVDVIMWDFSLFTKKGETHTLAELKANAKCSEPAEYVFEKLLDILVEDNVLSLENGVYTCLDNDPEVWSPAEMVSEAIRKIPEEGAAFQWLARGIGGLHRFISGKLTGEEVMFGPWSDFSLVGQVYFTSEVYGFWSKLAGQSVKRLINEAFDKPITVLEIGAGTGSGTYDMFQSLGGPEPTHQKIGKYICTEIHKRLIKKTAKDPKFADYLDIMEFEGVDVTKPLEEQDVPLESADLLYAVNVMHATDDILACCEAMYKLVKKGGYAVLGEIAPSKGKLYRYMELTFGQLYSYYHYNDKDLRPQSPILRPEQWIEYFKKAGFSEAVAIPGDAIEGCDRGGSIIAYK